MRPVDYRDASWQDVQGRLVCLRASVYEALLEHGPCTTRELAKRAGICILTVRPRVTELYQIGFVICLDDAEGSEGRYQALTTAEAEALFEQRQREARNPQLALDLAA